MTTRSCRFVFDPSEWESAHEGSCDLSEEVLEDGRWYCPHDTTDASEFCIFHQPSEETDPDALADAFLELVNGDADSREQRRERRQFIGAQLHEVPLEYAVLGEGSNQPIDLRYSMINDTFDLEYATVTAPLFINGSEFGDISAHGSTFDKRVEATNATFHSFNFQSCTFTDRTNFYQAQFGKGSWFNVRFEERAVFRRAAFSEPAQFDNATFISEAIFTRCQFERIAIFDSAVFHASAKFTDIDIGSDISFSNTDFHSQLLFTPASVESNDTVLGFTNSFVSEGELKHPAGAPVRFLLTDATLGDVELGDTEGNISLDLYHFIDTSFEGFDFAEYTNTLIARNWLIHPLAKGDSNPRQAETTFLSRVPFLWRARQPFRLLRTRTAEDFDGSAGRLRSTYLKAKNGAKKIGDNTASAEFFLHEMRYKRKAYVETSTRSNWSILQWVLNWGYNLTAGYGERPFRTVLFSFLIIILFGGIYSLLGVMPYRESIVFSIQAFVALVLGAPAGAGNLSVFAAFEAFVGAFMIALFVFTLTRSIRR